MCFESMVSQRVRQDWASDTFTFTSQMEGGLLVQRTEYEPVGAYQKYNDPMLTAQLIGSFFPKENFVIFYSYFL